MTSHSETARIGRLTALGMAAIAQVLALTGCTNMLTPIGENKYDCNRKENPASPYCHSFKSVEAATSTELPASRYDETMRISDADRLTGIAPVGGAATGGVSGGASSGNAPVATYPIGQQDGAVFAPQVAASAPQVASLAKAQSLEGLPVRIGPVVQRVWVKRFVDGNDLLVGNTVIYKEIVPSHWAGFSPNDASLGTAARSQGVYPHRPPAPVAPTLKPTDSATSRDLSKSQRNEFTQPGAKSPDAGDVAPVPATESGTTSMPQ